MGMEASFSSGCVSRSKLDVVVNQISEGITSLVALLFACSFRDFPSFFVELSMVSSSCFICFFSLSFSNSIYSRKLDTKDCRYLIQ